MEGIDRHSTSPDFSRDVIVPAFPGTLLLSEWIATKAIPGKTGTNHIAASLTIPFVELF